MADEKDNKPVARVLEYRAGKDDYAPPDVWMVLGGVGYVTLGAVAMVGAILSIVLVFVNPRTWPILACAVLLLVGSYHLFRSGVEMLRYQRAYLLGNLSHPLSYQSIRPADIRREVEIATRPWMAAARQACGE